MNISTATKTRTVTRCNIYLIFSQLSNSVECSNVRYLELDQVCIFSVWPREWIDCYLIEAARHLLRMLTQKNVLCENSIDLSL